MIQLENVTRRYGDFTAVDSISFQVEPSSGITAILGPNGAGKSTTMRMMSGYLRPTLGSIHINGVDLQEAQDAGVIRETRRSTGYLSEASPLYPEMLVSEFLEFAGRVRGLQGEALHSGAVKMVEELELGSHLYTPIGLLSKGFRQRVALAGTLIHDPQIVILDEPTSGLDPNQMEHIRKMIRNLGTDKTVILSTHILQEVEDVCERVIIIHRGRIVADDRTENLVGSNMMQVEIRGVEQTDLENKEGILRIVSSEPGPDHFVRYLCETTEHPPEKILASLCELPGEIREFRPINRSLQEIFSELTTQSNE